jgi:hypothetical protein
MGKKPKKKPKVTKTRKIVSSAPQAGPESTAKEAVDFLNSITERVSMDRSAHLKCQEAAMYLHAYIDGKITAVPEAIAEVEKPEDN